MTWPPDLPFALVFERACGLHPASLGMLYRRFLPVVYRYVLARVADVPTAEDITSETFQAVIDGIGTTRARDELGFVAWILGIARNQVAMHFRRLRGRREVGGDLPEDAHPYAAAEAGDPLTILTARESWSETVTALNRLTQDQRAVVLYRCVLGFSADEVATLLEKRPGTIRALQFRALAALARQLNRESDRVLSESTRDERRMGDGPRS
ncbi:MAG: RNA polymerase sigma factor [Ktedonobacterales bacterium]